ncbi:MAG: ABC transporter permease [Planctomycetota bacterium]
MTSVSTQNHIAASNSAPARDPVRTAARCAAFVALIKRDLLLLVRRPSRIAATVLTPALLWAFFASGFAQAVASAGDGATDAYTISLAAGAALLVVTFASIFGSLGLIRDRETGYLQAVLVGPTARWVVISARVVSGALLACMQASIMLLASAFLGSPVTAEGMLLGTAMLIMTALGLSGCCTGLAWHFRSIEGFHGIMAGVLLPAWLLSGAVFPPDAASGAMRSLMLLNPLSYCHAAVAGPLGAIEAGMLPLFATVLFGVMGPIAAVAAARGDAKR